MPIKSISTRFISIYNNAEQEIGVARSYNQPELALPEVRYGSFKQFLDRFKGLE
jgi:hypothetical protein